MLFLPLGLYTKIFRIPWVTCVLVSIIVVVSFQNFDAVDQAEKTMLRSEKSLTILQKKLQMISLVCQKKEILQKEVCESVTVVSQTRPKSYLQPLKDLQEKAKSKLLFRKDQTTLQAMIFQDDFVIKNQDILGTTPEYAQWKQATTEFDQEINQFLKSKNLLSRGNWNFVSLVKAQFVHGGYAHLFGNLAFFIFLSIFVELKVGAALYGFFFLLTGFAGLSAQLLIMESNSIPLMGASASIAGIAGAFTTFFWKKKLKVLATMVVYNRVIALPVSFFFPVLMFSSDIAGALNPLQTNVAHAAHLGGFVLGVLFAFALLKLDNLPKHFLFMNEFLDFHRILKSPVEKRLPGWLKLLEINSENILIHKQILAGGAPFGDWTSLSKSQQTYVLNGLHLFIAMEKKKSENLFWVLERVHSSWPLAKVFREISGREVRKFLSEAEASHLPVAVLLLEVLFLKFPKLKTDPAWIEKQQTLRLKMNEQKGSFNGLTA